MRNVFERFYPTDIIVFAYCALTFGLVLAFGRPLDAHLKELAFYGVGSILPVFLAMYVDDKKNRLYAFVRLGYPVILSPAFYSMTQGLIFLFTSSFLDPHLVSLEQSFFGAELTLLIDRSQPNVVITEILSFCYFTYYFMIPGFFLPVFLKRDYRIFKEATAAVCLTFFFSYLMFSAYPIEGPRWHYAEQYAHSVDGPFFRPLVNFVIANGAVHGGCMPSTHTAVALVLMMFCFRYYRRWGWIMLPIVVGLAASTVWGRFHYISDVIVGAAIGGTAFWIVKKYHSGWILRVDSSVQSARVNHTHVS